VVAMSGKDPVVASTANAANGSEISQNASCERKKKK